MTQILVLDPTIQKQRPHITDGFFIQILTAPMPFLFRLKSKALKKDKN